LASIFLSLIFLSVLPLRSPPAQFTSAGRIIEAFGQPLGRALAFAPFVERAMVHGEHAAGGADFAEASDFLGRATGESCEINKTA
jgi:hypothetical protein